MESQRIIESIQELPIAEQRKIALAVLNGILSQASDSASPIAFTMEEFLERINQAEEDIETGKTFSIQEAKSQIRKWK